MEGPLGYSGSYTESALGIALMLVAALSLGVGIWVVVRERARRVSLTLLAASIAVALYLFGFSFMVRSPTPEVAFRWARVAYLGVPFIVPALYLFSMEILGLWRERREWIAAAWVVGVVYAVLAVGTDLLLAGVERASWGYYTELTDWNIPIIGWSLTLLVMTIRDYWATYRQAEAVQRARIQWLGIPLAIAAVAFIDYGPSMGLDWPPVGFVFLSVFMLSAAWVVARYHLPDLTPAFAADQILDTMAEPLLVADRLGRITITNPAAARLLGWSEEELKGESLATLLGADVAGELLDGPSIHGREMEVEARTGEPIAVSVSTGDLVANDRPVGTVIVARDIRERRRAARQLKRREEYFRALIENARDTIAILDARGQVTYQSPSHTEILGRQPGEGVGRSVFERVHPEDKGLMQREFRQLLSEPGATAHAEVRMAHTSGEYRVIDVRAQNLLDHPAVQGIVVNGRDVTEERRLTERLQQSQKLESIGRLAGGIAHDFNNILTTIRGNVALMEEEVAGHSELAAELEVIRDGAERAGRLTSELLAFSRRQVTRPEIVDLNQLVEDLRSGFQRMIGDGRTLVVDTADEVGAVRVDRGQVEQAIVDLVMNARDATEETGRLEIATANVQWDDSLAEELPVEPGPYVRLTVADDGIGMDEETRQRVFEPFFTTKDAATADGLGLAAVYGTVRQARGHVEVESEPGAGTRFSIYLPRVDVAVDRPNGSSRTEAEEREVRGEVVLVVEDEAPVRDLVAKVLGRKGYTVLEASDGEAALRTAREHHDRIDLLIADLVMPGMSGREVAETLGAEEPDMATILMSGYTADEVVREGIEQGQYTFLPKPFDPATLVRTVAEVLGARQPG